MKRILLVMIMSNIVFGLYAQTWKLDKTHSSFQFSVTHLGISKISGTFGEYQATITASKEDFSDAVIEFSLETASVNTYNEGRNNHLRRDDMFDAENHPQITFKSTQVTDAEEDSFEVVGDLTIKGVTKTITLDLTLNGFTKDRRSGGQIAGFTATTSIDRTDFGVGGMPDMMVSNQVDLFASGEFKQQ